MTGEGGFEKNCCWRLKFRQHERKSSSESGEECLSAIDDVERLFREIEIERLSLTLLHGLTSNGKRQN